LIDRSNVARPVGRLFLRHALGQVLGHSKLAVL